MPTLAARTRKVTTYGKKRIRVLPVAGDLSDDEVAQVLTPQRALYQRVSVLADKENDAPSAEVRYERSPAPSSPSKLPPSFRVASPARRRRKGPLLPLPTATATPKRIPLSTRSSNASLVDLTEDVKTKASEVLASTATVEPERVGKTSVASCSSLEDRPPPPARPRGEARRTRASARVPLTVIALSSDDDDETTPAARPRRTRSLKSSSEAPVGTTSEADEPTPKANATPGLSKRLRSSRLGGASTSGEQADEPALRRSTRAAAPTSSTATSPHPFAPLLAACQQSTALAFDDFVERVGPLLGMRGAQTTKPRWTKLAEASFSEVFAVSTSAEKRPALEDIVVVKAIPLRGEPVVDDRGVLVEVPQETEAAEAERELAITKLLGAQEGFIRCLGAFVVTGDYPEKLLATWDAFAEKRQREGKHDPSECNLRPDCFPASQHYLLLCLPHCGTDLEHFRISTWTEAVSVLWQTALSLAKAEQAHSFEHRDLHWSNITVQRLPGDPATLALARAHGIPPHQALAALSLVQPVEWPNRLNAARTGVRATILDYTLSRANDRQGRTLCHPFDDEDLFGGEGDLQFDMYRHMRLVLGSDWSAYRPVTNVMWLYYLACKLSDKKGLSTPLATIVTTPRRGTSSTSTPHRGHQSARVQARARALAHGEMEAYSSLVGAKYALHNHVDRILKAAAAGREAANEAEGVTFASAEAFVAWFASAPRRP